MVDKLLPLLELIFTQTLSKSLQKDFCFFLVDRASNDALAFFSASFFWVLWINVMAGSWKQMKAE